MTTLKALQEKFQHYLVAEVSDIQNEIEPCDIVPIESRLSIYKEAYQLRLIEGLRANFSGLHLYLGDDEFNQLGKAYLEQYPSNYRSIRWFGDKLPNFIATHYDEKFACLAELSEFEWKMTLAFDAADAPLLTVQDLAAIRPEDWADLRFSLHPSVQVASYYWNAPPLWQALMNDTKIPEWQKNEKEHSWVIGRLPEYTIQYYSVSEEEIWALKALKRGCTFAEICEGLCVWLKEEVVGMRAASYLKSWIQKGMLTKT